MSIPKYILYGKDLQLIMGWSVDYHLELIPKTGSKEEVKGGGRMYLDKERKELLLYWESTDFGAVKRDDILRAVSTAWFSQSLNGYKVLYAEPEAGVLPGAARNKAEVIWVIRE